MPRKTTSTAARSRSRQPRTRLGDLERAVLEVLWEREDASVREVHEALTDRELAYTTVLTVLDRMHGKSLVTREKDARAFRYSAAATRGDMTADLMREALEEFSEADRQAALVAFVGDATHTDREALRRALAALEASSRA